MACPRQQVHGFRRGRTPPQAGRLLAIVEIDKKETPFGPPMNRRFSPEELKEIIPLPPAGTARAGEHFYMQVFRNSD
jgi:uncharacterized GH25 family protein